MSPDGFARSDAGAGAVLWLRPGLEAAVAQSGLDREEGWRRAVAQAPRGSGRGAVARLNLPCGPDVVIKRLRRGGLFAVLRGDRFAGTKRLFDNLAIPDRAASRGVATARAVALLAAPEGVGFWRGWLAVEAIEGADDLASRLRRGPLDAAGLDAVARLLRGMHDAGLRHRDLNLGNILLREGAAGPEAFVVDLDGANLSEKPLSFRARQAQLRRLERSTVKILGSGPDWYAAYAAGDPALARRFEAGRRAGRWLLAIHRLGWKDGGGGSR